MQQRLLVIASIVISMRLWLAPVTVSDSVNMKDGKMHDLQYLPVALAWRMERNGGGTRKNVVLCCRTNGKAEPLSLPLAETQEFNDP